MTITEKKISLIKARLKLAQGILEESDQLPSVTSETLREEHERHVREALVVYLLLTCFETLGRDADYLPFENWIKSKQPKHIAEVTDVVLQTTSDINVEPLRVTKALIAGHTKLYGVGNAFRNGINTLSHEERDRLFSSIRVAKLPEQARTELNASFPPIPIEDQGTVRELKIRYLYKRRNEFTHELSQRQISSIPEMPILLRGLSIPLPEDADVASWLVNIWEDGSVQLGGSHQERRESEHGYLVYTVNDWPFVLFEVLYSAISLPFDRTSIRLNFCIWDHRDKGSMKIVPAVSSVELCNALAIFGAQLPTWP